MKLPPSMSVVPNKQFEDMTLEELKEERDFWNEKIALAPAWGASLAAADGFRKSCEAWIKRREEEAK